MRKLAFAVVALLVAAGAAAQSYQSNRVVDIPFTTSGHRFNDDAGTVAHPIWNGTAISDPFNTWTQNGTVPQVTASPLYPNGFGAAAKPGAGPMSSVSGNFYSLGTGADVLDFTGGFTCCVAWLNDGTAGELFFDGNFGASGTGYRYSAVLFDTFGPASALSRITYSPAPTLGLTGGMGTNIVCGGRGGTTQYAKINLAAVQTLAGAQNTLDTTHSAKIGNGIDAGNVAAIRSVLEEWCSSTTPSDALFTAIQNRAFGHVTATGQTLTVTRATTATAEPKAGASPSLYTWPAGILRITENGALLEAAATNLLLQSEALDSASWTTGGVCTVTANQGVFADGQTSMEKVQCTGVSDSRFQSTGVFTSTTGPITGSVWMAATTGTAIQSMAINCAGGVVSTCTCARSDGGACTATILGTNLCVAYGTVGTTPVRMSATETCAVATTTAAINVHDGQEGTTSNIGGLFGGAQIEVAGYASSYVPTTTATVARNADVVTVANPLPVGPFCVTGTWTPALAPLSTWASAVHGLWLFGTDGAANSAHVEASANGTVLLQVFDAAPAVKVWATPAGAVSGSTVATITACSDNVGGASITVNGVAQSLTPVGAGTGILSAMGAITLNDSTNAPISGLKNFKVCRGSDSTICDRQPPELDSQPAQ